MTIAPQGAVIIICFGLLVILIVTYYITDSSVSDNKFFNYRFEVNNEVSSKEDGISIVIGDNKDTSSKIMTINGLNNKTPSTYVYSSQLSSDSGRIINNILFGNKTQFVIDNSSPRPFKVNDVSVNIQEEGIYSGFLYLSSETLASIPVSVSTDPKVLQAILIIVMGVLTSIIAWELFFVMDKKNNDRDSQYLSDSALELDSSLAANGLTANPYYLDIRNKIDLMYMKSIQKKKRAIDLENRYNINSAKIISIEIATVLSGILVGLTGYFSNEYISNLVVLQWTDVMFLFLTGMGIGSLKGLVER